MSIEKEFLESIPIILREEGWQNPGASFGFLTGTIGGPSFVEVITLSGDVDDEHVSIIIDPVRLWRECPSPFAENADWLRERLRAREWVMPERQPVPLVLTPDDVSMEVCHE